MKIIGYVICLLLLLFMFFLGGLLLNPIILSMFLLGCIVLLLKVIWDWKKLNEEEYKDFPKSQSNKGQTRFQYMMGKIRERLNKKIGGKKENVVDKEEEKTRSSGWNW